MLKPAAILESGERFSSVKWVQNSILGLDIELNSNSSESTLPT